MLDKYLFIFFLIITIIIVSCYSFLSGRAKNPKTWRGHFIMGSSTLAMMAYLVTVLSHNEIVSYIAYAAYYMAMDLMIFGFLRFCTEFTGYRRNHDSRLYILKAVMLCDFAMFAVNIFYHFIFRIEQVSIHSQYYLKPVYDAPFAFHIVLDYLMVILCIAILLYKLVVSPAIYWDKYGLILLITLVTVALNACYALLGWATDKSLLVFALAALWIYHNSVIYIPTALVNSTLMTLANGLTDALIVIDNDENCIYVNELATKLLDIEKGDLDGKTDLPHIWCNGRLCKDSVDFVKYVEVPDKKNPEEVRHLKLFYRRMIDNRGRYEGSYFQIRDLTDEINHIEQDKYRATHDSLTGLYNKEKFTRMVEEELEANQFESYMMICMDVNNFKFVNDLLGPTVGDQVLVAIGDRLKNQNIDRLIYGRLDNDHFAMLIRSDLYNEAGFLAELEGMKDLLGDVHFPLTINAGVYKIMDKSMLVSVMCDRAHMAIDTIKKNVGTQIAHYSDEIRQIRLRAQDIVSTLDEAIEKGEIKIFLQAQTDKDGKSHGAEALVRWIRDDGSMIFPNEFIPVLEERGAIAKLDMQVWKLAAAKLKEWKEKGYEDYYISVNISPKDFYYIDLYEHFTSLVKEYDIEPKLLKLEITETAIMNNTARQLEIIAALREAGFIVEIDDFGSGYSSLNMLKDIMADVLKVDMMFLAKSGNVDRSYAILEVIIDLARTLGMSTVVEGVETAEQLAMLEKLGCSTFQGYYFSRPIPVSEYEKKFIL